MKIWKMNECDWVAAETLKDAKKALADTFGCTIKETEDEPYFEEPHEIAEEEYDKLKIMNEERKEVCTFREELERLQKDGENFPRMFASTEY